MAFAFAADSVIAENRQRTAGPAEIFDQGQRQAEQRFLRFPESGRDDHDGNGISVRRVRCVQEAGDFLPPLVFQADDGGRMMRKLPEYVRQPGIGPASRLGGRGGGDVGAAPVGVDRLDAQAADAELKPIAEGRGSALFRPDGVADFAPLFPDQAAVVEDPDGADGRAGKQGQAAGIGEEAGPGIREVDDRTRDPGRKRGRENQLQAETVLGRFPLQGALFRVEEDPGIEALEGIAVLAEAPDRCLEIIRGISGLEGHEDGVSGLEAEVEGFTAQDADSPGVDVFESEGRRLSDMGGKGGDFRPGPPGSGEQLPDFIRGGEGDHGRGVKLRIAELELGQVLGGNGLGQAGEDFPAGLLVGRAEGDADASLALSGADDDSLDFPAFAVGDLKDEWTPRPDAQAGRRLEKHACFAQVAHDGRSAAALDFDADGIFLGNGNADNGSLFHGQPGQALPNLQTESFRFDRALENEVGRRDQERPAKGGGLFRSGDHDLDHPFRAPERLEKGTEKRPRLGGDGSRVTEDQAIDRLGLLRPVKSLQRARRGDQIGVSVQRFFEGMKAAGAAVDGEDSQTGGCR